MANHTQKSSARATFVTLMLRQDHQKVRRLCEQFHDTKNFQEKRDIVNATLAALEVLATLKKELIYPAWRTYMVQQDLIDEAVNQYGVVSSLMQELTSMDSEDKSWSAKFTVLSEHVLHRFTVEEGKIFPQAENTGLDWEGLTTHVMQRRQSLEHKTFWLQGIPVIVSSETVHGTRARLSRRSGGTMHGGQRSGI
jgi:hypothetical protein